FLAVAEELARPAGLTAARWQVLGAVLTEPLTVSGIARAMGITRQSVQRIADLLVDQGLAEYRTNPAHRRAKLLAPTAAGRARDRPAGHRPRACYGTVDVVPGRPHGPRTILMMLLTGGKAAQRWRSSVPGIRRTSARTGCSRGSARAAWGSSTWPAPTGGAPSP